MSETQSRSTRFGVARPASPDELEFLGVSQFTRYDLFLATIPVALGVSWLFARTTGVPVWAALAAGALAILPLLADGLVANPPA